MLKRNYRILLLFFVLLLFISGGLFAQSKSSKPCKPVKRANKNKSVTEGNYNLVSVFWQDDADPKIIITQYLGIRYDSVTVYKDSIYVSMFLVKDNTIISSEYSEYNASGNLILRERFDTSGLRKLRRSTNQRNFHYGFSSPGKSYSKETFFEDGSKKSARFYSATWNDSIFTEWYNSGSLRSKQIPGYQYYYYEDTRLQKEIGFRNLTMPDSTEQIFHLKKSFEYNRSGNLLKVIDDTLINRRSIRRVTEYYATGVLRSVHFFEDLIMVTPCHIWVDYDKRGILVKTENMKTVEGYSNTEAPVVMEGETQVYTYVEQNPEFPGGQEAFMDFFRNYMKTRICESKKELKGEYKLRFRVSGGWPVFTSIEGYNAESVHLASLKWCPLWSLGKRNGRTVDAEFIMTFKIEKLKK